jgi:hypothetical protein
MVLVNDTAFMIFATVVKGLLHEERERERAYFSEMSVGQLTTTWYHHPEINITYLPNLA